jgi:hypothetical protein
MFVVRAAASARAAATMVETFLQNPANRPNRSLNL